MPNRSPRAQPRCRNRSLSSLVVRGVVSFLALALFVPSLRAEVELFEDLSLEQALERAASQEKLVLVDYFTTWCVPCKQMDATTWIDPVVLEWVAENAIPVRFDAEIEVEQAKQHAIATFPTTLLLRPDGSEIDRLTGFKSTEELLADITDGLQGKDAIARAREKWQTEPENLSLRMFYAKELANKGRHEEALHEYLACWDAPVHEYPKFAGVRGSFLLGDILRLAKKHPPAREAMESRRKEVEIRALSGAYEDTPDDAFDALASYGVLSSRLDGNDQRVLDLFERVEAQGDRLENTFEAMLRPFGSFLLEAQRYDLLIRAGEPEADFAQRAESLEENLGKIAEEMPDGPRKGPMRESILEALKGNTLSTGLDAVEILLGAGESERAHALVEKVAAFDGSRETFDLLAERARRAGVDDLAVELSRRAEAAPPAETSEGAAAD